MAHEKRKIAAVLAADVVGYSRLIEVDEPGTFQRLRAIRKGIFEPQVKAWHGRLFKEVGDCFLVEFGSVVDAVHCALGLQRQMIDFNSETLKDRHIQFRVAINLCDVIIDGNDLKGDGINVAARLQERADPGGIVVSSTASDHLQGKIEALIQDLGEQQVKNINRPIRAYRIQIEPAPAKNKSGVSNDQVPVFRGATASSASWLIRGSILAAVAAFAAWVLWLLWNPIPSPGPILLSIASSSGKGEWLDQAVASFNASSKTDHAFQLNAQPVFVKIILEQIEPGKKDQYRSGTMVTDILTGRIKPVIASPADNSWISKLNKEWDAVQSKRITVSRAFALARTPVVLAMWESRARALECWPSPQPQCTWERLRDLATSSEGWAIFGRPRWGRLKLGLGQIGESNSGTLSSAVLCLRGLGKSQNLTLEEVSVTSGCGKMIADIEKAKVHSGRKSSWLLDQMRTGGPDYLDAIVTNEQEIIEFNRDQTGLKELLVAVYPQDGTVIIDHPFAILDGAPWVSSDQVKAAVLFRQYLLSSEQQSLLVKHGLRPVDPKASLGFPLVPKYGANPEAQLVTVEIPEPLVMDRLQDVWREVKKHAFIAILFDKSSDMAGENMTEALAGAQVLVSAMDTKDWLAWLAFDDQVHIKTQGIKAAIGEQLLSDIRSTAASGGTAFYDAVATALDMIENWRKSQGSGFHYGIVIFSDGRDTSSTFTTMSLLEARLRSSMQDATGVQIHTIGIGTNPDEAVLKKIANLAHGRYWKVSTYDDAAEVYKEIATYY